jgi:hypothetical protein
MATRQGRQVFEGGNLTRAGATIAPNASGEDFIVLMGDGDGSGRGGGLVLIGGSGGSTGLGGTMRLEAGSGGATSGAGGDLDLFGGTGTNGVGGDVNIIAGDSTNAAGGNAILKAGASINNNGGAVQITGGASTTNGNGGAVQITAGSPTSGAGANVSLTASNGAGTNQNGGSVIIASGNRTGSGTLGSIVLNTYNSASVNLLSLTSSATVPLRFFENPTNGANYVSFQAPASIANNVSWILPASDGTARQVLYTDGNGVLGWQDVGNFSSSNGESFETTIFFTTTNNNTQTAFQYAPGSNRMTFMETFVTAKRTNNDDGAAYIRRARFRFNNSGAAGIFGLSTEYTSEDVASWDHTLDANGNNARVRITGQAGVTINWIIRIKIVTVVT